MAGFAEVLLILLLLVAVFAALGLVMYVTYRLGLYVALNFTKTGRSIPAEESE